MLISDPDSHIRYVCFVLDPDALHRNPTLISDPVAHIGCFISDLNVHIGSNASCLYRIRTLHIGSEGLYQIRMLHFGSV